MAVSLKDLILGKAYALKMNLLAICFLIGIYIFLVVHGKNQSF